SPNVGAFDNYLLGVAAVSANDVWAVGHYLGNGYARTLAEQYTSAPCGTPTDTPTPTLTYTPIPTDTDTPTLTATNTSLPTDTATIAPTNTPSAINLTGHVTWAGSTQPNNRQMQPLTLTLCATAGGPTST